MKECLKKPRFSKESVVFSCLYINIDVDFPWNLL